jgi:Tol biopolymer transport system component
MANDLPGCHNPPMLRGLILAAALLALLGFGSGAGHVRNGRIAYGHLGAGGNRSQIYTTSPAGGHRHWLTNSRRYSSLTPSYSPNGKRILFMRADKQADLWTMNANGSDARHLTRTKGVNETEPAWSPDGKEIVFSVESPAAQQGIWIMNSKGFDRRRLTTGADHNPAWSPDGADIAYQHAAGSPGTGPIVQIYVVPAAGGLPTNLTNDPSVSDLQPAWSPDGSRILFSSDRGDQFQLDLWVMNPDGSGVRQVTHTPGRDEHDPAWSPDGRRIVYVGESSSHGAASYQLYVSRADGSNREIITHACRECAILNDEPSWQPAPR